MCACGIACAVACVYAQRMNRFIDGEDIRLPSPSIDRGLLLLLYRRRSCSRRAGPLPQRSLVVVFVGRRLLLPLLPSLHVVALLPLLLAFLLLLFLLLAVLPFLLQLVLLNVAQVDARPCR